MYNRYVVCTRYVDRSIGKKALILESIFIIESYIDRISVLNVRPNDATIDH